MSREIIISTVSFHLPSRKETLESNLERAHEYVKEAIKRKSDICCLPEIFTVFGVEDYTKALSESVSRTNSILDGFSKVAAEGKIYLIINIPEKEGDFIYNTAFFLDRNGELLGKYRKTHLAPGEEEKIREGDTYPVFKTDFGSIGIMICMDIHFPEVSRIYGLKNVDILFWPTMSYGPSDDFLLTLLRSKAMDNQYYCVASNYSEIPYLPGKEMGRACVVAPDGNIITDTGYRPGIATIEVDLDEGYEYWASGDYKKKYPRLKECFYKRRKPETYGELVKIN
tara:strand:+ start:16944 stop:17792 length:849 start_codon:yes stop_codon:yes gene_type:complete